MEILVIRTEKFDVDLISEYCCRKRIQIFVGGRFGFISELK
jgi:hypothetical protein